MQSLQKYIHPLPGPLCSRPLVTALLGDAR